MTKFNIGDKVKVVDNGESYSTYQTWATKYGMKNYVSGDFMYASNGTIATVIAVGSHLRDNAILTGIRTESGQEYILGECGLELVSRANLKDMLTNGRRVKLRNDTMFTVLDGALIDFKADDCNSQSNNFQGSYKENLTHLRNTDFDIVSIYERPPCVASYFNYCYTTDMLWQREEKTAKQLQLEALQKQAQDVADAIKKLQDEE